MIIPHYLHLHISATYLLVIYPSSYYLQRLVHLHIYLLDLQHEIQRSLGTLSPH